MRNVTVSSSACRDDLEAGIIMIQALLDALPEGADNFYEVDSNGGILTTVSMTGGVSIPKSVQAEIDARKATEAGTPPPGLTPNDTPPPPPGNDTPPPPPAPSVDVELDVDGIPWDARIHGAGKSTDGTAHAKNKDGRWKTKRGANPTMVSEVRAELLASTAGTTPPLPPSMDSTPPPPPPPPPPVVETEIKYEVNEEWYSREYLQKSKWTDAQIDARPSKTFPVEAATDAGVIEGINTFPELMAAISKNNPGNAAINAVLANLGIQDFSVLSAQGAPDQIAKVAQGLGL